jgi:hypothetical protein
LHVSSYFWNLKEKQHKTKNKSMKIEGGLKGRRERGKGEGEGAKRQQRGGEDDQSTLYACVGMP